MEKEKAAKSIDSRWQRFFGRRLLLQHAQDICSDAKNDVVIVGKRHFVVKDEFFVYVGENTRAGVQSMRRGSVGRQRLLQRVPGRQQSYVRTLLPARGDCSLQGMQTSSRTLLLEEASWSDDRAGRAAKSRRHGLQRPPLYNSVVCPHEVELHGQQPRALMLQNP
jgi:hypothetical protein